MSSNPFSKYIYHKNILPLGLALIILLMVFTSIFESNYRKASTEIIWATVAQQERTSSLLHTMSYSASQRTIILTEMLYSGDPFEVDELSMVLRSLATEYVTAITALRKQDLDPYSKGLLYKVDLLNRISGPIQYKVYDLLRSEEVEKATALFVKEAYPQQKVVFTHIKDIESHQIKVSTEKINTIKSVTKKRNEKLNILNLLGIIVSFFLTVFIIMKQSANDKKLAYQATTDILTELPNRGSFIDCTKEYIESLGSNCPNTFAVVFFDVDHFKSINDNYGHEVGDKILRLFSSRILSRLDKNDILSRFGGDEFVLLLKSIKSEEQAIKFIHILSEELDTSFMVDKQEVFFSASIGMSLYSPLASDAQTLLKNADIAMYTAKEAGRNCYKLYSEETSNRMTKEHGIAHALRTILKDKNSNRELYVMYQPLLDIKTGETTECEALIRWTTQAGEIIPPDEFIPLAEKSNIIEKINLLVIDETCKQQCEWQRTDNKNIRININLSGNKAIFRKLLHKFKSNLNEMNLSPNLFGIELTERTLHEICQETINELDELRNQGVKISIDDFGTDYSSLMYLRKLPVTTLKIDKGFVDGLPDDRDSEALVKAIITLGHSLNLDIVAEGVENKEQLEFLKKYSCNTIQGYYYQHPLKAKDVAKLELVA